MTSDQFGHLGLRKINVRLSRNAKTASPPLGGLGAISNGPQVLGKIYVS